MFNFFKSLFKRFRKEPPAPKQTIFVETQPELSGFQTILKEHIDKRQTVLLIRDNDGQRLKEGKSMLELNGYFLYYINMEGRHGPYNIFHNMNINNYQKYVEILSVNNKTQGAKNLNHLLLTSVLLSMLETRELSWPAFTKRISSIHRENPEFVVTAIDEKIKQAFHSFKEMVKFIDFFDKEFDIFKEERFQKAESYIPSGKIAVFYKEYEGDEAFMNETLLLEFDQKGII